MYRHVWSLMQRIKMRAANLENPEILEKKFYRRESILGQRPKIKKKLISISKNRIGYVERRSAKSSFWPSLSNPPSAVYKYPRAQPAADEKTQ